MYQPLIRFSSRAQAGGDVALLYNSSKEKAEAKAADLEKRYGVKSRAIKCQAESWESNEAAVEEVVKEFGRIDVFVANVRFSSCPLSLSFHLASY